MTATTATVQKEAMAVMTTVMNEEAGMIVLTGTTAEDITVTTTGMMTAGTTTGDIFNNA
jgi:hypothetical protein